MESDANNGKNSDKNVEKSREKRSGQTTERKSTKIKKQITGGGNNMPQSLKELTEIWKGMERRTLAQREKANQYYDQHLISPIIDTYILKNRNKVRDNVRYLIMSVGTSYEPIVLNISLLQPEKILFLYTEQTEYLLKKIVDFLKIGADMFQKRQVDATDALSVYYEIKQAFMS